MRHIRQKNAKPYTVIVADEPLENHYLIVNNLNEYEVSNDEIPSDAQYLNFVRDIPNEVALWKIRTVLKLMQLETAIETALNSLSEPTKTAALYIWDKGNSIDRYSQTILFLQSELQMTNEQVDDIFIQANQIVL